MSRSSIPSLSSLVHPGPLARWLVLGRRMRRWWGHWGKRDGWRLGHTEICREGFYYVGLMGLVFLTALGLSVNLLLILAGMMVGPLVFSWKLVLATLRGLELRRKLPAGVCAGDLLVVQFELKNARPRLGSWAVVAQERIRREGEPAGRETIRPAVYFHYVPAGRTLTGAYRGRLPRRGRYVFGPVVLSTRFPFGLLRRTLTSLRTDTLVVLPRLGRLTRSWQARHHEWFEGTSRRERRHSRVSGDLFGVPQWQRGDSRRWIHWRASARRGELVVRQYEQHRNRDVALLVDLWEPAQPGPDDRDNVELAVSFAATVVADACRKGGANLVLGKTSPRPECLAGAASPALLREALEWLAVAEASPDERLGKLLADAAERIEPGTEVIVVSTRPLDLHDGPLTGLDPSQRSALGRIRLVNTSSPQLAEYFEAL